MVEIWDKTKINQLSLDEKEQWFDVLNYKLEEDRLISLEDPDLKQKQMEIKQDYFEYIENCPNSDTFYKYYILKISNKIISVCRINVYSGKYLLEGLQTHKDYYKQGYAYELLEGMICDLKNDGIDTIFSEARIWNIASNNLQKKVGFVQYGCEGNNNLYVFNLSSNH